MIPKDSSTGAINIVEGRTLKVTDSGVRLYGTRNDANGNQSEFTGFLSRKYMDLTRASMAARRKYHDYTISVLKVVPYSVTYEIPVSKIPEIAIAIVENNG